MFFLQGSCATVLTLEEAKDISKELKETAGLPDPNAEDDKLFYTSVEFTLKCPTLEVTSEETETEYASIQSSQTRNIADGTSNQI